MIQVISYRFFSFQTIFLVIASRLLRNVIHVYLLRSCFTVSSSGSVLQFPCLVSSAINCRFFYAPVLNCISRIESPTVKTTRRVACPSHACLSYACKNDMKQNALQDILLVSVQQNRSLSFLYHRRRDK